MKINIDSSKKTQTIRARVTPEQKKVVFHKAEEGGFDSESEYVLFCCLKGIEHIPLYSPYQLSRLKKSDLNLLRVRVTTEEKHAIVKKYEQSGMHNFSRFIRNCCLEKQIIVIEDLKEFAKELNKIGNNLNQLTMLCHQGLIELPDISETKKYLEDVYKELISLNKKTKLSR